MFATPVVVRFNTVTPLCAYLTDRSTPIFAKIDLGQETVGKLMISQDNYFRVLVIDHGGDHDFCIVCHNTPFDGIMRA
jgi:hypothetical protein